MNNESNFEQSCNLEACESCPPKELVPAQEEAVHESHFDSDEAESPVKPSAQVTHLKQSLESVPVQQRIEGFLQFMKQQLNPQSPNFRDFWEARKECAICFRELEDAHAKTQYLDQLQNLCAEAKGLKVLLDEQSQFAMEQISLAIDGVEKEIDLVQQQNHDWKPQHAPVKGQFDQEFYAISQGLLNWLNGFSTRISGLRKELMKTDMRVRHKNKLFSRLSQVGDKIFPPRKNLIREVSEHFVHDVEHFTQRLLEAANLHVISAKEDVKNWQSLAKELTLNTHAFKKSRELLSQCWEHLKKLDKQLHSQRQAEKSGRKARCQVFVDQLEEIKKLHEAGQLVERMLLTRLDDLLRKARKEDLLKEDAEALRQSVMALKQPILDKQDQERAALVQKRDEAQKAHDTVYQAAVAKMQASLEQADESSYNSMKAEYDAVSERLNLTHEERQVLLKMMSQVAESTLDRRVDRLIAESKKAGINYKDLYRELHDCRTQLRSLLESHKKDAGASGLSFERAMILSDRMNREKQRIERVESVMLDVQEKID